MTHRNRGGFTLIEMLLVIAVLGLMTAGAIMRLWGPVRAARTDDVLRRIEDLDASLRQDSRHSDKPTRLICRLTEGVFLRGDAADGAEIMRVRLPDGYRIDQLLLVRQKLSAGEATIECRDGRSSSYAMRIATPDGTAPWLLFAGLSGNVTRLKDDKDVDAVFASLPPGSASDDAH